jgi:pheromone shutdown protein TraB
MTTDDVESVHESAATLLDDPRIRTDHLRLLVDEESSVLLVGVVHDHPASVYRVRSVVRSLDPDTAAVELPPLALPLFEAGEGGEMSAALAASEADAAAVDAHGPRFLAALAGEIRDRSPSRETIGRIVSNAVTVGKHAISCRLASVFGRDRFPAPIADAGVEIDVDLTADPVAVAEHEQRHLSRSFSVLRAFERPAADEIVDAARERTMARSLATLDAENAVAVVGFEHLDGIADELVARGIGLRGIDATTLSETAKK